MAFLGCHFGPWVHDVYHLSVVFHTTPSVDTMVTRRASAERGDHAMAGHRLVYLVTYQITEPEYSTNR